MKTTLKKAVVMGASSGLGREVALLLLEKGWRLALAARRMDPLEEIKAMNPERVEVATIDVNRSDSPQALRSLIERLGGMDLFFYAPGVGKQNMELAADVEMTTVETNAMGFTRMVGEAYRYMASHGGGHIAAITSIAGTKGLGAAPSYSATKAFQSTYLQALEQQATMRGINVTFTDLRPGFVATDLLGDNPRYPMLMQPAPVARAMVSATLRGKHVAVINKRWRVVTALWRRVPRALWRHMPVR